LAEVETVSGWLAELDAEQPPEVEVAFILRAGPPLGATWTGTAAVVAPTVFAETREEAERLLAPFATCPVEPLFADVAFPLLYADIQGRAYLPADARYAVDTIRSHAHVADVSSTIARHLEVAPSALTAVVMSLRPPPADDRAAFTITGPLSTGIYTVWTDEANDEANIEWLRGAMADLEPYSAGQFVAEADLFAPNANPARCYTPSTWARLQALRARVDPDNRFASYPEPVSTPA
jgi:hypothetical protein